MVVLVAGSSIFSRASTAGVLVIAANRLSTADLGLFATLFGIAVAAAYVLASTSGNTLAYWIRSSPEKARRVGRVAVLLSVGALVLLAPIYLGLGPGGVAGIAAATFLLLLGSVMTTILLQLLRGLSHLTLAVAAGFLVPSVLRLGLSLALVGGVSVSRMLAASGVAAAIGGLFGAGAVLIVGRSHRQPSASHYALGVGLSLAAGTVGLMWFAMGQVDLTSLTLLQGPAAGGEYAPTMRAFEAMNALGLAVAFLSIRALAGAPAEVAVARIKRILPPSLALYAAITAPLLLFGHSVLGSLLGEKVFWSVGAVLALAVGYGGNLVMSLCFETFASQRATATLFRVAVFTLGISIVLTPLLVARWGIIGAALGNSVGYLLGGAAAYQALGRLGSRETGVRCG
jgi:O-antigen/teichoic acid export membrane protein